MQHVIARGSTCQAGERKVNGVASLGHALTRTAMLLFSPNSEGNKLTNATNAITLV